jgi:hypothetical protein
MKQRWQRIQVMKEQLDALAIPDYTNLTHKFDNEWSDSLRKDQLNADHTLQRIEEEIRCASIREYMAKAASHVHQNDVLRMQTKTNQAANAILQQIEKVKTRLLEQSPERMTIIHSKETK